MRGEKVKLKIPPKMVKAIFNSDYVSPGVKSTIVAWLLLFAISPSGLCLTSVEVQAPSRSSPTVRLTVLLKGKPQKGVKVKIYQYKLGPGDEVKPRFSLISDPQGRVSPPKLTPGHYHVVASAAKNLRADLYLDVSEQANEKASEFSMELAIGDISREELFTKADQMPIKDRLKVFRGIVRDLTGAPIAGVSIEVVRKRSQGRDHVVQLESGKRGQFSASLSDGSYIALFSAPGFQIQVVPFEITEQGSGDLRVTLELGRST
jgi:5-hydroxyisourate hydrolase-like protein (transthyretin family)